MGLSGRKNKQRIPADPRNLSWANDANKFGTSYLQKFGWDPSAGLGPSCEGRTKHISVHQKLDMLGIGADHRNSQDGTAWKQGRDFENLLRRLNESAGKEGGVDIATDETKVDGFVKPSMISGPSTQESEALTTVDTLTGEPKKSKKRKQAVHRDVEASREEEEKERKRRKKSRSVDESLGDEKPKIRGNRKPKNEKSEKNISTAPKDDYSTAFSNIPKTLENESEIRAIIQPPVVPRPLRAHRARHIASKGLISKSAAAISEILGLAPASSTSASLSAYSSRPSFDPISSVPSGSTTPSPELKLQDLTTSSKSVMDYFREKLAAKSGMQPSVSSNVSINGTPATQADEEEDRPRIGLGGSRARMEMHFQATQQASPEPDGRSIKTSEIKTYENNSKAKKDRKRKRLEPDNEVHVSDGSNTVKLLEAGNNSEPGQTVLKSSKTKRHRKEKKRKKEDGEANSSDISPGALAETEVAAARLNELAPDIEPGRYTERKKSKRSREKEERKRKCEKA